MTTKMPMTMRVMVVVMKMMVMMMMMMEKCSGCRQANSFSEHQDTVG